MVKPTIIHGPQACGKTRNAELLGKAFAANRVIDEWHPKIALAEGDLALTNCAPPFAVDANVVAFSDAIRAAAHA